MNFRFPTSHFRFPAELPMRNRPTCACRADWAPNRWRKSAGGGSAAPPHPHSADAAVPADAGAAGAEAVSAEAPVSAEALVCHPNATCPFIFFIFFFIIVVPAGDLCKWLCKWLCKFRRWISMDEYGDMQIPPLDFGAFHARSWITDWIYQHFSFYFNPEGCGCAGCHVPISCRFFFFFRQIGWGWLWSADSVRSYLTEAIQRSVGVGTNWIPDGCTGGGAGFGADSMQIRWVSGPITDRVRRNWVETVAFFDDKIIRMQMDWRMRRNRYQFHPTRRNSLTHWNLMQTNEIFGCFVTSFVFTPHGRMCGWVGFDSNRIKL